MYLWSAFKDTVRSPLTRKVTGWVFVAILSIEAAILIPSYLRQEAHLTEDLLSAAQAWAQAAALFAAEDTDPARIARSMLRADNVTGADLIGPGGTVIAAAGEPLARPFEAAGAGTPDRGASDRGTPDDGTSDGGARLETSIPFLLNGTEYLLRLRIDRTAVEAELDAYVLRIVGLIVLITAVLTVATLLAVGLSVLHPLSHLSGALATGRFSGPQAERGHAAREDEIGDLYRALSVMFAQLRSHQDSLGDAVAQRTAALEAANARLQQSEHRFKDFANASSDFYWEMDRDLRFSFISDRFEEVTGIPTSTLLGKRRRDVPLSALEPEAWERHLDDLAQHRAFRNFILPRDRSDGQRVYLSISGQPIFDGRGDFAGYRGTGTDVTAAIDAEQNLKQQKALLELTFSNMEQGVTVFDADMRLVSWNQAYADMWGLPDAFLERRPTLAEIISLQSEEGYFRHLEGDGDPAEKILEAALTTDFDLPSEQVTPDGAIIEAQSRRLPDGGILRTFADVTERRHNEETQRALLASVAVPIFVISEQDTYIYINDPAAALIGRSNAEAAGKNVISIFANPADRQRFLQIIWRDDRADEFEAQIRYSDGRLGWGILSARKITFQGRPASLTAVSIITERKRAEEALRQNEALLRTIFDNASIGILQQSADSLVRLAVNQTFCDLTGYGEEELLSNPKLQITHPEDQPETSARRDRYGRGEINQDIGQFRIIRKDGSIRWVSRALTTLRDENGKADRYVSFVSDITDRIRAEADVQERERVLRKVLDNVNSGILMVDPDLRVEAINQQMIDLFQVPEGLVEAGKSLIPNIRYRAARGDFGPGDVDEIVESRIDRIRGMADNVIEEHILPHGVVETRWTVGSDGSRINVATDITRRKSDERLLKQAKEDAERISRSKSDLIATVSHEVRTPMNGVLGMARLLEESDLDAEQRELLETIIDSGHSLIRIVNDLLDFSKLEAGQFDLESTPFIASDVIGQSLAVMAVRAREKGLDLWLDSASDLPEVVVGDPFRLRQVILNLLSNAVRFTDQGSVTVRVSSRPRGEDRAELRISVIDTGRGIKPEEQERLFSPYTQLGIETARKYGGTGLGLTISRKLVERMGGSITLESEYGKGSAFTLTVPFAIDRSTDRETLKSYVAVGGPRRLESGGPGRSLRVLQVEDNPVNQKVAIAILTRAGHRVHSVDNGAEALDVLKEETFDAILMDRDMPVMDGTEATRAIRALPSPLRNIPIIGITAGAQESELTACLEAGMDTIVTKPVHGPDLVEALRRLTRRVETDLSLCGGVSVLVVDDTQINRTVAAKQLRRLDIACTAVERAADALRLIEQGEYHAVLSDITMPDMTGESLAAAIRARETAGAGRVPLIAMTGLTAAEDRDRVLAAGFDDILAKPVTLSELAEVLGRLLHAQAPSPFHASPEEPGDSDRNTDPIDLARLSEVLGEAATADSEWIAMFIGHFPPFLTAIESALQGQDREALGEAAHAAKSAAGSVAATTLADHLEKMEQHSGSDDWSALNEICGAVRAEFDRVARFCRAP